MPCPTAKKLKASVPQRTNFDIQLENAFPNVKLPAKPLNTLVTVQFRMNRSRTASGLILAEQSKVDIFHDQVVKILAIGENAFQMRNTETGGFIPYREGPWYTIGDYVRIPKHGVDVMFHRPSVDEMEYIKQISDEARKTAITGDAYIADEGFHGHSTVKFGQVFFYDISAKVENPLVVLNAH